MGELLALAAAATFGITSINDKLLTARVKPITLAALSSMGGALLGFVIAGALGKLDDLANVNLSYLSIGIVGGILNTGLGLPLYLLVLRFVDVSKAFPTANGLYAILTVLSGIFLLRESPSALALAGIVSVIIGAYLLSFAQRGTAALHQAPWLGIKGMSLLLTASLLWAGGFTLQGIAVEEVDPFLVNSVRLAVASLFSLCLVILGVNKLLINSPDSHDSSAVNPTSTDCYKQGRVLTQPVLGSESESATSTGRQRKLLGEKPVTLLLAVANGSVIYGFGSLLYLVAIEKVGLAIATVLTNTQMLILAMLSVLILRETLRPKTLIGITAIFAGIILIII